MAAQIEIRTDEGILDLANNAENDFYITRQIHDLHSFESRNADFTKTIYLPPTANNLNILRITAGVIDGTRQNIPCSISLDGIQVAPLAFLVVIGLNMSEDVIDIEVFILYGNFNFFNELNKRRIDQINWADLAVEWEVADIIAISTNTSGVVWPVADWTTIGSPKLIPSTSGYLDINATGCFVYVHEILSRSAAQGGFELLIDPSVPDDYHKLALAIPVDRFFSILDTDELPITIDAVNEVDQIVDGIVERAVFVAGADPDNNWNGALNQWENLPVGEYVVYIKGTYSFSRGHSSNAPSRIVIFQMGVEIAAFELLSSNDGDTDVLFYLSASITLLPTHTLYAEIQATDGPGGNDDILTLNTPSAFNVVTYGISQDRNIQLSDFMPQIEQSVFFANIMKLFNLMVSTNDVTKVVTIESFDKLFDEEYQDLSDKVDVSRDSPVDLVPSIGSLGQISEFRWAEDSLLRRDENFRVNINNQILDAHKVSVSMIFSASDNSITHWISGLTEIPKAKLPMAEVDVVTLELGINVTVTDGEFTILNGEESDMPSWNIGSYFSLGGGGSPYRVIRKTNETSGQFQGTFTNLNTFIKVVTNLRHNTLKPRLALMNIAVDQAGWVITQGEGFSVVTPLPANSFSAEWLDSLKWSEIVTNGEYKRLIDALRTPAVLKMWFVFTVAEFEALDLTKPVYLAYPNGLFYINKVEQFKINQKVRVELIRINSFE